MKLKRFQAKKNKNKPKHVAQIMQPISIILNITHKRANNIYPEHPIMYSPINSKEFYTLEGQVTAGEQSAFRKI